MITPHPHMQTTKPCLRCGRSLDDAPLTDRLTLTCACGVIYSAELVEHADPGRWMRMFTEDGYEIHDDGGNTLAVRETR